MDSKDEYEFLLDLKWLLEVRLLELQWKETGVLDKEKSFANCNNQWS